MAALKGLFTALVSVTLFSGCAVNMKVPIKEPVPSTQTYARQTSVQPTALYFKDEQSVQDRGQLMTGLIPMQLMSKNQPFNASEWLAEHTVKELAARGLPVTQSKDATDAATVLIKRIHILNHRVSGFSPFVTFTTLQAELITPKGPQRMTAYIKRGKVPVWTFDEVIEPTFNEPLTLLTKELAAKINRELFKQAISDDQVRALVEKINKTSGEESAYQLVFQLGYGNNKSAVPELIKLSTHSDEYVRQAAISSLGILQATEHFALLVKMYENKASIWQDRAIALKAIGDLNTAESRAYLQKEWAVYEKLSDKESTWNKAILALYL